MGMYGYCYSNAIIENNIVGNGKVGIDLNNLTSNNTIFFNTFIGNALNAQDNGILNQWDNGILGNYWDNYAGIDANNDGIGDTPYLIDGTTGSMDNYPKLHINPFIGILDPNDGEIFREVSPNYNIVITELNLDFYDLVQKLCLVQDKTGHFFIRHTF